MQMLEGDENAKLLFLIASVFSVKYEAGHSVSKHKGRGMDQGSFANCFAELSVYTKSMIIYLK